MKKLLGFILISFLLSCSKDSPGDVMLSSDVLNITGTRFSASNNNFENTYTQFIDTLQQQDSLQILVEVDHAANARGVGRVLNPNKLVFFLNAKLATQLLQKNQLTALDLPNKVLFFQNNNGVTFALYNSISYFDSRYALEGISALSTLDNEMQKLVKSATSAVIKRSVNLSVDLEEGIITKESNKTFTQTYADLKSAIASQEGFEILKEIDYKANAVTLGIDLRPTTTFVVSNPTLGTALIQDAQTAGLDLPEDIVIWQDSDSIVKISYNDPKFLQLRHDIPGSASQVALLAEALDSISNTAISQ